MGDIEIKERMVGAALMFAFLASLPFAYFYVIPESVMLDCSNSGESGHVEIPECTPK